MNSLWSNVVSRFASPESGLRVLTPSKLDEFKSACKTLAKSIARLGNFANVQGVGVALNQLGLTSDQIVTRFTEAFRLST